MVALVLALIGLPVGFALDWLITLLAVPTSEQADEEREQEGGPIRTGRHLHSEAGVLVLAGGQLWAQRVLVIGATVALFALAGGRYGGAEQLAAVSAYISVLIVCAATDILAFRVPNVITYPAIAGTLLAAALMPGADLVSALGGGLLAGVVLLLPALLSGGVAMGLGDVKLAVFVGLALGFTFVVPAMVLMALGGGAMAAILLLTGARKRRQPMPYAPFISAGALATLLWQGTVFASLR